MGRAELGRDQRRDLPWIEERELEAVKAAEAEQRTRMPASGERTLGFFVVSRKQEQGIRLGLPLHVIYDFIKTW